MKAYLRRLTTRFLAILLLMLGAAVGIPLPRRAAAQDVAGDLLNRINTLRASLGLPGYSLNGVLSSAASVQAQWMVATGEIAHYHPDGTGPRDRALAAGYSSNWVSENIYMGQLATVDSAWNFWINSPVHYAGLTSVYYADVGIASAAGNNRTSFVLVFGNPTNTVPRQAANNSSSGSSSESSAPAGPPTQPPYVKGIDSHGNIMHEIQPGDTLGQIALEYGYTWDDIPYMLEINGLTEADASALKIGDILLVPPHAGTYTPTPGEATQEPLPTETPLPALPTGTPLPLPTATEIAMIPTPAALVPSPVSNPLEATAAPTGVIRIGTLPTATPAPTLEAAQTTSFTPPGISPALIVAVVVQVLVLLGATFEFIRRLRR